MSELSQGMFDGVGIAIVVVVFVFVGAAIYDTISEWWGKRVQE